jgi:hypothetical protein
MDALLKEQLKTAYFSEDHSKTGCCGKRQHYNARSIIEEDSALNYAILDKNVILSRNKCLKGEKSWPIIIGKNVIV